MLGSSVVLALAAAAALVIGLAACGQAATVPSSPATVPTTALPASPVEGVIIAVDASSLSDVRGFTLLTPAGQRIVFRLGTLENPTEFPPGHLAEHQATSEPVRVFFRVENGTPVVYRLADASSASPGSS